MPGYLLAAAFHKQAFASATQHQLLAFLQVAAFTNRTAVLPFARVGEPAFVGLPRPGFGGLDRYFDVAGLAARWPCLRAITYDAFRREAPRARIVALQLGLPPGRAGSVVAAGCGRRSRPLVALGATFACASAALAASASATLGDATRWRRDAVIVTNWSQKLVGLGDAASPLFGDAFAARGGCQDARAGRDAHAFPPLAPRWHARADAFLAASPVLRERAFVCAHVRAARPRRTRRARSARPSSQRSPARARTLRAHRTQAEKLASAATGRAKRNQWVYDDAAGAWTSPYMERCAAAVAAVATRAAEGRPLVLLTDTAEAHGTPSNQGSARFREWRGRGERLLRALLPAAAAYCGAFAASEPDCAVRRRRGLSSFARRGEGPPADVSPAQVAEAAICRRAAEVLRFGSGTFSAFLVGDGASRPPSAQFLSCPEIERAASLPHSKS